MWERTRRTRCASAEQVANTHTNSMPNIELEPELNSGNAASSLAASCHTRVTAKCARDLVNKLDVNHQFV